MAILHVLLQEATALQLHCWTRPQPPEQVKVWWDKGGSETGWSWGRNGGRKVEGGGESSGSATRWIRFYLFSNLPSTFLPLNLQRWDLIQESPIASDVHGISGRSFAICEASCSRSAIDFGYFLLKVFYLHFQCEMIFSHSEHTVQRTAELVSCCAFDNRGVKDKTRGLDVACRSSWDLPEPAVFSSWAGQSCHS